MQNTNYFIKVAIEPMREGPSTDSQVVSEALYSECITLLEKQAEWLKIRTPDSYEGWIRKNALHVLPIDPFKEKLIGEICRPKAHLYGCKDTSLGPLLSLPFESRLLLLEPEDEIKQHERWLKISLIDGSQAFIQRGDLEINPKPLMLNEVIALSKQFLGLPYTWGGRSSFGYDCSGFVQMLYRKMGISIPRDSKDQVRWENFTEISLDQLLPGDLIFFGPTEGRVTHVAFSFGDNSFIHTSIQEFMPYLRISSLKDEVWSGNGPLPYRTACRLKK